MTTSFGFPFHVDASGAVRPDGEDAELRGQVLQVLFTAPGERVNQPEFGCGLFNLVFDPDNTIMAAAVEFSVGSALTRWLGDRLVVGGVDVRSAEEALTVEVAYVRRKDMAPQALRVRFR
ncbi:GPW/gp25 family protein [Streptomyces griseorubiginosus]|uniref:GPW/gp25 family protein n=1 Tax=Streptomyces griseorubiginosus TaxID=67304 RepID=UPI0011407B29|nr:GPW/gp25 family protein [Streptomyces griseorubiginosus]